MFLSDPYSPNVARLDLGANFRLRYPMDCESLCGCAQIRDGIDWPAAESIELWRFANWRGFWRGIAIQRNRDKTSGC